MIFQIEQYTINLDIFVFCVFTIATVIFWIASRGRDDLKGWRIAYVIYNIGFFCKVLGFMDNGFSSVFSSLKAVFYLLSSLLIFFSILKEYIKLKKEDLSVRNQNVSLDSIIASLFVAPLTFGDIMSRVLVLGILFCGIFMLIVIWNKKRTPTLTFLLLSFIVLVIGIFISSIPTDSLLLPLLNKGVDAVSSTLFLSTGIVISYENRLVKSETKVKKAEQIAAELERNSLISNELKNLAEQMSSSAEEISSSSENISSSQSEISRGVTNQVSAIQEIQREFSLLIKSINEVNKSMVDLDNLTSMIRNISEQTNMLALNAAIEAARAGEAGKGFNVVAEQVRKLAAESKKSVEESNKKITSVVASSKLQENKSITILQKIDAIAAVSEETSASTEETAAAAEEQAAAMVEISNSAQKILYLSDQILNENFKTSDFIEEFKQKS